MSKGKKEFDKADPASQNVMPVSGSAVAGIDGDEFIKSRILTIRGVQVMLSSDLALLYDVEVKHLHRQVKRNANRFPSDFVFHLSPSETKALRCQNVTSKRGGDRYGALAFSEQGVAMLSSVLKSDRAAEVNVAIMRVFVAMRRAIASFAPMLMRLDVVERRQIVDQARNEERFKLILDAMQDKKFPPQKVFYDGQIYDAFEQMKKFVRMAKTELIIIDPYFADSVLPLVAQKRTGVSVLVVKNSRSRLLHNVDVTQFNAQYANSLTVKVSDKFHDRFLIIDKTTLIHVGASLNHLGKKCFAFSSLDKSNIPDILAKL